MPRKAPVRRRGAAAPAPIRGLEARLACRGAAATRRCVALSFVDSPPQSAVDTTRPAFWFSAAATSARGGQDGSFRVVVRHPGLT
jgi:hypothetical protein